MAKVKQSAEEKFFSKAGVEITPELADRLADEAERGYEGGTARRQFVGRPSLGERGTSPRVSFRLAPELCAAAQRRADQEERSLSELARDALARYLDSE